MAKINEIIINGFKAFPTECKLELKGKNLLMYGENGSGKSSIYYALHCLFNSYRKPDMGKKYFDISNPQNLINKNFIAKDARDKPYVAVNWYDGSRNAFLSSISHIGCQEFGKLAELDTCFINHQLLFSFFNFTNSKDINLFPIFQREILPYIFIIEAGTYMSLMYEEIIRDSAKLSNKSSTKAINNKINIFNICLERIIGDINLNASVIYNTYFKKEEGEPSLSIILSYPEVNPQPDILLNGFRLKWDYPLIVNTAGNLVKAPNKSIINPIISIDIKENGKSINKPHVHFNEAKLTAIALSIRFALLNLNNPAEGSFLALDDMLISLDMSNRAKVVNFLLKISDKYKIYLFTHDKMFFEYVKHKTKKNKSEWMYKEIYMDNDNTPYIRDSKDYLEQADHYIKQHEYEIAGNFLRKAAESLCKDFLPKRWHLSPDYTILSLNGLIKNCKTFAEKSELKDITIFEELDGFRKFILNPASHDSYDVIKYRYEVEECLHTLRSFQSIIVRPFLKRGVKLDFELTTPPPFIEKYKFEIILCDDFKIIEQPGKEPIISTGMINYRVIKNGIPGQTQSDNTTIKRFYDINYKKSDKSKSPNYLNSITVSGKPICNFL